VKFTRFHFHAALWVIVGAGNGYFAATTNGWWVVSHLAALAMCVVTLGLAADNHALKSRGDVLQQLADEKAAHCNTIVALRAAVLRSERLKSERDHLRFGPHGGILAVLVLIIGVGVLVTSSAVCFRTGYHFWGSVCLVVALLAACMIHVAAEKGNSR
jgi:hypothetical protein